MLHHVPRVTVVVDGFVKRELFSNVNSVGNLTRVPTADNYKGRESARLKHYATVFNNV